MNALQLFESTDWKLRVTDRNGEPWFIGSDVCKALGLDQVTIALDRLDDDEGGLVEITHPQSPTKTIMARVVSEAGLYSLVLSSRKPESKAFKRWVTHEVLPTIRKKGAYSSFKIPENYAEALQLAADQARQLERALPLAAVAEKIASADNAMTIKDFAKSVGEGPIKIFGKLKRLGVIYRNSNMDWVPYQEFIDREYFRTHVTPIPHGERVVNHTTALVTGKGEVWLTQKLMA